MTNPHPTRSPTLLHRFRVALLVFLCLPLASTFLLFTTAYADDVTDFLQNAKSATAPAPITPPDAPENQPTTAHAALSKSGAPEEARPATLLLSNNTKLEGPLWTTAQTPFRVWIDADKSYHDIDLDLINRIEVHVLHEGFEEDWRWLKEGSDQKIFSGQKYPNVELSYLFTLLNDQTIEGTITAPIYLFDGTQNRTLALNKKCKGLLDQPLKDLIYIKSIAFATPPTTAPSDKTTHLPLLD